MRKKCRMTFYQFTGTLSSLCLVEGNNNHPTETQGKSSVHIVPIWFFNISVYLLPQIIWNCLHSLEKNIIRNHMKTFLFKRALALQMSGRSRIFSRSPGPTEIKLKLNYFSEISTNLQHFHNISIPFSSPYWPQKLMPPRHRTINFSIIIWRQMFVPYF